ncbi:hypothetical protein [Natronogracilivirga saccharolytica]|uniref:Uncharacterized protein n=1 Tax=Natronogracilivirga saccharolytica TaxID=2812953 RepID=A0A8J7UWD4_9BACT|nr:hypothetical protein [Natronogracilivirga saccharolytica]MBP3193546.1 hypothetical protein [Natronogracilivirga saccharolytica]
MPHFKLPDTHILISSFLLLSFFTASCGIFDSDDSDDDFEDGISVDIREFIDDQTLSILEDSLKMPIHRGDSPPDVMSVLGSDNSGRESEIQSDDLEGRTVVMSPMQMVETLVPGEEPGDRSFVDTYFRMRNLDMDNLTIDIDRGQVVAETATGAGGYIIGDDMEFTIFAELEQDRDGDVVVISEVFSGEVTPDGIQDPHLAIIILDDADRDDVIPEGTGRSFDDGQQFAELTEWPEDFEVEETDESVEKLEIIQIRR